MRAAPTFIILSKKVPHCPHHFKKMAGVAIHAHVGKSLSTINHTGSKLSFKEGVPLFNTLQLNMLFLVIFQDRIARWALYALNSADPNPFFCWWWSTVQFKLMRLTICPSIVGIPCVTKTPPSFSSYILESKPLRCRLCENKFMAPQMPSLRVTESLCPVCASQDMNYERQPAHCITKGMQQ